MSKKAVSQIPRVRHVYRIPTRAVYLKKRLDAGKSWNDVYGKARCAKCHQHFQEGDVYELNNAGKGQHVECPK